MITSNKLVVVYGPENIGSCCYCCCSEVSHFLNEFYVLQVSLYLDKFSGVCQSVLHDCKLIFLQIICDHDLFVEMPGRDPSDRYFILLVFVCFTPSQCKFLLNVVPLWRTSLFTGENLYKLNVFLNNNVVLLL